jgi:hypothetical protein
MVVIGEEEHIIATGEYKLKFKKHEKVEVHCGLLNDILAESIKIENLWTQQFYF